MAKIFELSRLQVSRLAGLPAFDGLLHDRPKLPGSISGVVNAAQGTLTAGRPPKLCPTLG